MNKRMKKMAKMNRGVSKLPEKTFGSVLVCSLCSVRSDLLGPVTVTYYTDSDSAPAADANAERADSACARCGHSWGSHCYDREGNELPDVGRCNKCECYSWR